MKLKEIIGWIEIEKSLESILSKIHQFWPLEAEDFEKLAYYKKFHSSVFEKYENKLMYLMWLFYKVSTPKSFLEEIYAIFANTIEDEIGECFTPVQADAYKKINEKTYFSFSAPTSAGKSYLFRELILKSKWDIIIVVPSRALIAEYLSKVKEIIKGDKSILVLQFIENINIRKTTRRIYIITHERWNELFNIKDQLNIELFLFDEAQVSEEYIRGMKFDAFVRRADKLIPSAKKVFAHPFIDNPEAQLLKHDFSVNSTAQSYKQLSVWKIYLSIEEDKFSFFSPYTKEKIESKEDIIKTILENNWTLLIFTSKSKIYEEDYLTEFNKYITLCPKLIDEKALYYIHKLKDLIGANNKEKSSILISLMERWIVIHHWSIPLKARLLIENFINDKHARICFATWTLLQWINMPFDAVYIENFKFNGKSEDVKVLNLKNLIWRAGRTKTNLSSFDYWYVIIDKSNIKKFCSRIQKNINISTNSLLDSNIDSISDDLKDIVEAIKEDSFNDEFQLTNSQLERLKNPIIDKEINFILDKFLINNTPISWKDYYKLPESVRKEIKWSFQKIFISHLRRNTLTTGESAVLSTAIPLLLWKIQWKSFKEILWLRYSYISERDKRKEIRNKFESNEITPRELVKQAKKIHIKYSQVAEPLPNETMKSRWLFPREASVRYLNYDILVYDTYDYLDKVISLSLADPISATFQLYFDRTNDVRALVMKNYIKYWTNDEIEIWLLRYGFDFEDILWIKVYIDHIDENQIKFNSAISHLDKEQLSIIEHYI